jgi:hypothetical protein
LIFGQNTRGREVAIDWKREKNEESKNKAKKIIKIINKKISLLRVLDSVLSFQIQVLTLLIGLSQCLCLFLRLIF